MTLRCLSWVAAAAIALCHAGGARGQLLGFEDCRFSAAVPANVGIGQRLAEADRLDSSAQEYEEFPYKHCFRLGRSCPDISPEIPDDISNSAHARCGFYYPALHLTDYEDWQLARTAYNECMGEFLRRKAREIRNDVLQQGEDGATASEVLGALSGSGPSELDANGAKALSTDVTWCPADGAGFTVAILCKGGGMVVGMPQSEKRLEFSVLEDGAICLWDFTGPETCHKVTFAEGRLVLRPRHQLIRGAFTVVPGVDLGQWRQNCYRTGEITPSRTRQARRPASSLP